MAEGEDGGWWRSWLQQSLQTVKEKSTEALEFMKRDLTEFTQVVQHDTACTIAATASVVKEKLATENSSGTTEKVRKGLSNFLGVISDTFAPSPDKTIDCDVITLMATPSGTTELYDSAKARLYSLQSDPATYCNEPDGPSQLFEAWLSHFNLEEKKGEISDLLVNSPSIRSLYSKMVPAAVSHSEFWQRYFYKVHQLEQEEVRREALKQRAEQSVHSEEPRWEEEEEEFLGSSSSSPQPHTQPSHEAKPAPALTTEVTPTLEVSVESWATLSPTLTEATPSESSESVSLMTQVTNPASAAATVPALPSQTSAQLSGAGDLSPRLPEVPREEPKAPEPTQLATTPQDGKPSPEKQPKEAAEGKGQSRTDGPREEAPMDLRLFELNSDSGKSTPSNNGKKGSSTDVSEDWEKDFDLDMTEEEVQLALSKADISGELDDEEWADWE
ncbi:BSD domain-containing protein 1 isoform X2 [Anolis carolinensis]|uniref:BSD domain containing 1 n=1 Tax=Anolis carolinensis TaxID=28377 RepID=H9G9I1_ANOCA|nr:PREDICTED: BSD domain-containing protein 1 isoform X2 [Anolis carolinensis]|eukprot:XP_008120705.1 PREDICTED: BSD domain-containing protein 1 isoform X2 [Anolis carolinensis]